MSGDKRVHKVSGDKEGATMVTGDPMHELINLRRALPNLGHDFADIYFDHTACLYVCVLGDCRALLFVLGVMCVC